MEIVGKIDWKNKNWRWGGKLEGNILNIHDKRLNLQIHFDIKFVWKSTVKCNRSLMTNLELQ